MAAPLPISAYIRTLNEARLIAQVVEGAKLVAAEVIIVDCGSTDGTIDIATKAGARVVNAPWLGGGKQKRLGEDAASHDWLLDLDADEIVTPALAAEIRDCFAQGEPNAPVFEVMMATHPPVGAPWLTYNLADRRKLYDRRAIRQPDHANWDQLQLPSGMRKIRLREPLLHYSFRDLAQLEEKFNRNSSGRARDTKLKPFWMCALRMLFARPFYFLNHYLRRGLWRAGWYGYAVAQIAAHGRWLKDAKMVEIHLRNKETKRGDD